MKTLNDQLNEKLAKNKKRFYTSDLHFDDDRLNLYGRDLMFKTSEEVDNYIIEQWNNVVSKDDLVILLGDISMTSDGLKKLELCNGEKWLVKGNYDKSIEDGGTAKYEINDKFLSKYFSKIVDELEIEIGTEKVYLNHFPTNAKESQFSIVGHIHGTWKVQRNMINVGVDAWHFVPVSEDRIKFQMNGIRKFYDQNVYAGELNSNINNKKGIFKVLRAPIYDITEFNDDMIIFLAGPIQGAPDWQENFIKDLEKEFKDSDLKRNIVIANPKRLDTYSKEKFSYDEQVNWESYYLNKAANQGIMVFYLPLEEEKVEGRSYAQTSRFEIGEWFAKGQNIKDFKIIVGYEKGFSGIKYIEKKFKDTFNLDLITSKKEMIETIKKYINN